MSVFSCIVWAIFLKCSSNTPNNITPQSYFVSCYYCSCSLPILVFIISVRNLLMLLFIKESNHSCFSSSAVVGLSFIFFFRQSLMNFLPLLLTCTFSSNLLRANLLMILDLPTPLSPKSTILIFWRLAYDSFDDFFSMI